MKLILSIWYLFFLCSLHTLTAQGRYRQGTYLEAGGGMNLSWFDIGKADPGISVQGGMLYDLSPGWRLGAEVGFHGVNGSDEGTSLASRGYAYHSRLTQIGVKGVYVPWGSTASMKKRGLRPEPRAFITLGFMQFSTRPNALLATLQNGDFLQVSPYVGVGLGLSIELNRYSRLLLEAAGHLAASEYMDLLADPEKGMPDDVFCSILLKFAYKLPAP